MYICVHIYEHDEYLLKICFVTLYIYEHVVLCSKYDTTLSSENSYKHVIGFVLFIFLIYANKGTWIVFMASVFIWKIFTELE